MNFSKKIWHILSSNQRRDIIILLGMMMISMVLETFGIGLVIPAMILITQNGLADKYPFIEPWLNRLGHPSDENLIVIGMSILIGMYVAKTLFLVFLAWSQGKFLFGVQVSLSQRLYAGYLRQPYLFHVQRNSAQLIRNVVTETEFFTYKAILPAMTMMTELLVMLGITALLLYVEPFGAILVAVILGAASIIFHALTKKPLLRWGEARQLHDALRLQHLQQGLGGAKEVKLFGREEEFLAQYNVHNVRRGLMSRWENLLQTFPRLYLELLAVCSLAGLILTMLVQHKPVADFMPALGLFAAAAFRLMPASNRLLGAAQNLRYSLPIVNTLYSEIIHVEEPVTIVKKTTSLFSRQLALNNVSYQYPGASEDTIEQVNLLVNKGTSVGLIGESGAGKSTLIDLILGLLTPSTGQIEVDSVDIQLNVRAWQDQIGYVSQSIYLSDDTIRRNIAFGLAAEQIEETMVQRAIKAAQLDTFIASLPNGLDTLVGERGVRLSGGQRQRIGIARALYHNPSVLVLDEATSSLDIGTEEEVMREVHELQGERTLIIVAHRMSAVKRCDRLIQFDQGKVVKEIKYSTIESANVLSENVYAKY
jgi:ABC-type multidrug transport system fused ATPase/permease subunit